MPTIFMSNAPRVFQRPTRRCAGRGGTCSQAKGGKHVQASGRAAKDAARYSDELCMAMIRGMMGEMQTQGVWRPGEVGLHAATDEDEATADAPMGCSCKYRADIIGQLLRDDLFRYARSKELRYFCDNGVWVKRPAGEARQRTGKGAISVRWVGVNKGDGLCPRYS